MSATNQESHTSDTCQSAEPSAKRLKAAEEVNNNIVMTTNGHRVNRSSHEDNAKDKNDIEVVTKDNTKDETRNYQFEGFSGEPSLEQIRQMHAKFCGDRNWDQFHTPRNILLALVGEVGEVSELFQWRGECGVGLKDWSEKDKTALEEELSDCLIYLVRLADRCAVDLPTAVVKKLAKNEAKYPIEKAFGSSKKYTEYE